MPAISVLLIDSNPTFLRIAARLLQEHYHNELMLVGISSGNDDAIHKARHLAPQIILVGLSQHSLVCLRLIPHLRTAMPTAGIIVLGSLDIHAYRQAATDAGADAFIAKVAMNNALLPTITTLTGRAACSSPSICTDGFSACDDLLTDS